MPGDPRRAPGPSPRAAKGRDPVLAPGARHRIGQGLRAAYAEIVHEPVPERLLDLIRSLEAPRAAPGAKETS